MKKHLSLLAAAICLSFSSLNAQNFSQLLEKVITQYSALKEENEILLESVNNGEDAKLVYSDKAFETLNSYYQSASSSLEKANLLATTNEKNTVKYFNVLLNYEMAFCYYNGSNYLKSEELFKFIYSDFQYFSTGTPFPLSYQIQKTNYTINFNNFSPLIAEYFSVFSEISLMIGNWNQSVEMGWKVFDAPIKDSLTLLYTLTQMMDAKINGKLFDPERLNIAYKYQEFMVNINKEDRETIEAITSYTYKDFQGVKDIIAIYQVNPSLDDSSKTALKMAYLLENISSNESQSLYKLAVTHEKGTIPYLKNAYLFFTKKNEGDWAKKTLLIIERLVRNNQCEDLDFLAKSWSQLSDPIKTKKFEDLAKACIKQRKKDAKKRNIDYDKGNILYVATNPFPWISKPDPNFNIGVANIKHSFEIGYRNIQYKRDYPIDISGRIRNINERYRWNGHRFSMLYRRNVKSEKEFDIYAGIYTSYSVGTYESFNSYVTNPSGLQSYLEFTPKMSQIHMVPQLGIIYSKDRLFFEYYFGLGISRMQFHSGIENSGYGEENYIFSDPLLNYRKPTSYKPEIRWGITIGISFL